MNRRISREEIPPVVHKQPKQLKKVELGTAKPKVVRQPEVPNVVQKKPKSL